MLSIILYCPQRVLYCTAKSVLLHHRVLYCNKTLFEDNKALFALKCSLGNLKYTFLLISPTQNSTNFYKNTLVSGKHLIQVVPLSLLGSKICLLYLFASPQFFTYYACLYFSEIHYAFILCFFSLRGEVLQDRI